ncbi:hypothetical protein BDY24DRAFT_416053 [Mrakia frigida]|uniref:uncharacterized protein n=1 Tax=Mrakia frigida TaxID=29902 RepID=UPI003FCC0F04
MVATLPILAITLGLLIPGFVSSKMLPTRLEKRVITSSGPVKWITPNPSSAIGQCYPLAFDFTTSVEPEYLQVISYVNDAQIRTKFESFDGWVDSSTRMRFTIPQFPYTAGSLVLFLVRGSDGAYSTLQGTGFTVQQSDVSSCLTSNSTYDSSFSTMTGQGQFTVFRSSATLAASQTTTRTADGTTTSPPSNPTTGTSPTSNGDVTSPSSETTTDGNAAPSSPDPTTNSAGEVVVASPSNSNSLLSTPSAVATLAAGFNSTTGTTPTEPTSSDPAPAEKKSVAAAIGGGVVGGVVGIALLIGMAFFFWRRNIKRMTTLGRVSLVGSDEKLPESGVAHPPPEPWTYSAAATPTAIPMSPLDNGVRVERDAGFQNNDLVDMNDVDVLPPVYSDATSRAPPTVSSHTTSSSPISAATTKSV